MVVNVSRVVMDRRTAHSRSLSYLVVDTLSLLLLLRFNDMQVEILAPSAVRSAVPLLLE